MKRSTNSAALRSSSYDGRGSELLTDEERRGLKNAGYVGSSRPSKARTWALLVVDVTWGFCGRAQDTSLQDATEVYPHASGAAAWAAIPNIRSLVGAARASHVPSVFTRPARPHERPATATSWEGKNQRQRDVPDDAFDLIPELGARPDDLVLPKQAPSAFFGTPLRRWLTSWGVDGVVVCGGTTSGCVRATVVDAFSHDLAVEVAADATFDRVDISHRVTLLDAELKYASVRATSDIVAGWTDEGSHRRPPLEDSVPAHSRPGGDAVPP